MPESSSPSVPSPAGTPWSQTLVRWVLLPSVVFIAAVIASAMQAGIPPGQLTRALPALVLMLAAYFALGDPGVVSRLTALARRSRFAPLTLVQAVLVPYLAYSLALGIFSLPGFLKLALYVNLPTFLLCSVGDRSSPLLKLAVILMVWLPIELRWLDPVWTWPSGQPGYYLYGILAVILAVLLFGVGWPLPGLGYTFLLTRRDLKLAVGAFIVFVPPAALFGILTGFLRPADRVPSILSAIARFMALFLATGIPEELLFRGLIQNLLESWSRRPRLSLLLASLVFGLAHLNPGGTSDWRFVILATGAGLVYGQLYRRSGSLLAPAIAHTLVDECAFLFFRR